MNFKKLILTSIFAMGFSGNLMAAAPAKFSCSILLRDEGDIIDLDGQFVSATELKGLSVSVGTERGDTDEYKIASAKSDNELRGKEVQKGFQNGAKLNLSTVNCFNLSNNDNVYLCVPKTLKAKSGAKFKGVGVADFAEGQLSSYQADCKFN